MSDEFHFRREDRAIRWQRIADHLARNPEDEEGNLSIIERDGTFRLRVDYQVGEIGPERTARAGAFRSPVAKRPN